MPTYVCSAATGRLTSDQKTQIVRSITETHHEETGAPPNSIWPNCARCASQYCLAVSNPSGDDARVLV